MNLFDGFLGLSDQVTVLFLRDQIIAELLVVKNLLVNIRYLKCRVNVGVVERVIIVTGMNKVMDVTFGLGNKITIYL